MNTTNVIRAINRNKRFLISTHVNPDPDALCSELALAEFLRLKGKHVTVVNEKPVSRRFYFLPGVRRIKSFHGIKRADYDAAIIVDCGELERVGKVQSLIHKGKTLVNIDHHVTNDRFGTVNCIDTKSSSTAEVLFDIMSSVRRNLGKKIATNLYVGILTDTGSFRYENTSAKTHNIVAQLLKYGISSTKLYAKLYETIAPRDLKEYTKVINSFDLKFNNKVAYMTLNKKTLSKFSDDFDLRDTIFKFLRSMRGVEIFVIFTEVAKNETRINLRSASRYNVAKLASRFGGGGHKKASGCMYEGNLSQSKKAVLNQIRKDL